MNNMFRSNGSAKVTSLIMKLHRYVRVRMHKGGKHILY